MSAIRPQKRSGTSEKQAEPARIPRAKLRLVSLSDIDGRTHAAKATLELRDRLLSERGGEALGAIRVALIESVALLTAMITDQQARWLRGDPVDPSALATLINARRREAEAVGIDPAPLDVTPTLSQYLASRHADADGAAA